MKKLVVSLAVLGLIGMAPASAHDAPGVKCRAKIVGVTTNNGWQVVETRVRITNVSNKTLKPELDAGIYDLHGNGSSDDEWLIDDELPAHKLTPGEFQRQHSYVNVPLDASVDEIRIDHCHRTWHFDS